MNLATLIALLMTRDPCKTVKNGFGSGHSDRGDYSNASFDPVESTTFGEMLMHAMDLRGTTQQGYKGGEFVMYDHVEVHIGEWGTCGEPITFAHLHMWDAMPSPDVDKTDIAIFIALLREQQAYHLTMALITRRAQDTRSEENHMAMHDKIKAALKGES